MADQKRNSHRSIIERIVVRGLLELESPAHFGSGDPDPLTDMPVLLDEVDNLPLLPGPSIAGALRNYLREIQRGDGVKVPQKTEEAEFEKEKALAATLLFGGFRGDDEGEQSPLIVEDSIGTLSDFELRDGVAIEASTRTAADDQKFDIQLLGAGTTFPLQFELVIRKEDNRENLLKALATALKGFEDGAIMLGARKRRGFGKCKVAGWEVSFYNLQESQGLVSWLSSERVWGKRSAPEKKSIQAALSVSNTHEDKRNRLTLKATFNLDGTLLIRSGFGDHDARADTVHLHAVRTKNNSAPVIPGTSWAGVLRGRALKIARTLSNDKPALDDKNKPILNNEGKPVKDAQLFVDKFFGPSKDSMDDKHAKASRVRIEESEVRKANSLEITRVKIDRFTGGAYESALFTEQPLVGSKESEVDLILTLSNPSNEEAGLLLLLLKDLWTGDLPIGGESGVGRGKLQGRHAMFIFDNSQWEIHENEDGSLKVDGDQNGLEELVKAFNTRMVSNG